MRREFIAFLQRTYFIPRIVPALSALPFIMKTISNNNNTQFIVAEWWFPFLWCTGTRYCHRWSTCKWKVIHSCAYKSTKITPSAPTPPPSLRKRIMEVIVHFLCMLNIFGNELYALFTWKRLETKIRGVFSLFVYAFGHPVGCRKSALNKNSKLACCFRNVIFYMHSTLIFHRPP